MILNGLFILLVMLSLTQPNMQRTYAAIIFITVTIIFDWFSDMIIGEWYYVFDAMALLLIVILTMGINKIPKMVIILQRICLVAIAIDALGYYLYMSYQSSWMYDYGFIAVYIVAILAFIDRDLGDERGSSNSSLRGLIRWDLGNLRENLSRHGKKI